MMTEPVGIAGVNDDPGCSHGEECPDALHLKVTQEELGGAGQTREQWRQENREAMECYNERIEGNGTFSDGVRSF